MGLLRLAAFSTLSGVEAIEPDPTALEGRLAPPGPGSDFRFDMLVLVPGELARAFISGVRPEGTWPPRRPELYAHFEALVSKLEPTYEHGDPVPSK